MVRVATFNVENLFSRAKAFNFYDHDDGNNVLKLVGALQGELEEKDYDKKEIIRLYKKVKDFVKINVIRIEKGRYVIYQPEGKWTVPPDGCNDWFGYLEFRKDLLDDITQKNIAQVILDTKADILGMVEVENRITLNKFNSQRLDGLFPYNMLIDGNDDRGIDVGLYSKYDLGGVWTNIYDTDKKGEIFSRDCLEVEVILPSKESLFVLINHFKSKSGSGAGSDNKRNRQAKRVAKILNEEYDLEEDYVAVMGDLNDIPSRPPLKPLLNHKHLHDVLKEKIDDSKDRWTYYYGSKKQFDYLLVSDPLMDACGEVGIIRNGIVNVDKITKGKIKPYDKVKSWRDAASDHGAVWAEFNI